MRTYRFHTLRAWSTLGIVRVAQVLTLLGHSSSFPRPFSLHVFCSPRRRRSFPEIFTLHRRKIIRFWSLERVYVYDSFCLLSDNWYAFSGRLFEANSGPCEHEVMTGHAYRCTHFPYKPHQHVLKPLFGTMDRRAVMWAMIKQCVYTLSCRELSCCIKPTYRAAPLSSSRRRFYCADYFRAENKHMVKHKVSLTVASSVKARLWIGGPYSEV